MRKRRGKIAFILICILLISIQITQSFGEGNNLSYEEIEEIIEEVAKEKNIPSVILKAIAWKESRYQQFDSNGQPFVSAGNTGIMQINRVHKHLDQDKLRNDIRYNIEAGADVLLGRWYSTGRIYPTIGDMDPNILENWYFALWGYNGWVARNNPNVSGDKAYQEQIFQLIRDKYDQSITSIDASLLPSSGLPKGSLKIPTPEIHHFGDLNDEPDVIFKDIIDHPKREYIEALYEMGIVSGVGHNMFQPDSFITMEQVAKILIDGLGLELVEETAIVEDWDNMSEWAKDYITTAYQHDIILADQDNNVNPKVTITREEAIIMLFNGLGIKINEEEPLIIPIKFKDSTQIRTEALRPIAFFIATEVLMDEENKEFRPKDYITRGELSELVYKVIQSRK
ncbi:S-layer homology domain-containing protein [Alkaliphilus peptidifermentans]|uniref:S-layer homology domain-containing protein n=1 Tax=Alkaliphilus peptidifermentans DSM 18978 TaxID=1120976 RepID=A0A1G5JNQ0_9FIRM|nr:S-layer homology domain-containing protein [Alkaliphilus peptidifermentans]SCY89774.1 S-layer homology domain-containing protein [Alkaliphilus peptidifermentans DSM 18978]